MNATLCTSAIAIATAIGVVVRPFQWPEAVWAVAGAGLILALGILTPAEIWSGIAKGFDVYLFLIGMMLLSELARREGLFDWVAVVAISHARRSPRRLFVLIYLVGVAVTALLSNDATAVVLTPAVYAACRAAKVKDPLPYLYTCAFIANAASFLLPISNPANLVIFAGGEMPPLSLWFGTFLAPSIGAVVVTFLAVYWSQRHILAVDTVSNRVERPPLTLPAKLAGAGLLATTVVLISASAINMDLGLPTFLAGGITSALVLAIVRQNPVEIVKGVSWGVLPLVAGLFVIVEAAGHTGITAVVAEQLKALSQHSGPEAIGISGVAVALFSNLVNNLPAGLFAATIVQAAQVPDRVAAAVLIGVDLGPNLSVTGSLATILWLSALRREGLHVSGLDFLKLGAGVMTPALGASLLLLWR